MNSIENGATIRIGFKEYDATPKKSFEIPTYSLKINKKSFLIFEGGHIRDYLDIYKNAAKEIAKIMNDNNIKEYVIYNGERVRMSNNLWVSCLNIPQDGKKTFIQNLEDCLNGIQ